VFGCLDQALPGRVPAEGASCNWTVQLRRGPDQAIGGAPPFETVFFNTGGSGARPGLDGLSATAYPSGVKAMPVEVVEHGAPIVVWRKELRADSGGAGEFRGGLGVPSRSVRDTLRPICCSPCSSALRMSHRVGPAAGSARPAGCI
jgi:N-methylhydantoinase B